MALHRMTGYYAGTVRMTGAMAGMPLRCSARPDTTTFGATTPSPIALEDVIHVQKEWEYAQVRECMENVWRMYGEVSFVSPALDRLAYPAEREYPGFVTPLR